MQKRYLKIFIFTILLAVVAVCGYLYPSQKSADAPIRILLDNNAGRVVFDHQKHIQDYSLDCQSCHHEQDLNKKEILNSDIVTCGTCHGVVFDAKFKANHIADITSQEACVTCHHLEFQDEEYNVAKWGHDEHVEGYALECTSCHHGEDIEPEPSNCANCHASGDYTVPDPKNDSENVTDAEKTPLGLKYAVHTKCAECHEDMFEAGITACVNCHVSVETRQVLETTGKFEANSNYTNCASCHDQDAQDLVPDRMSAFHGKCITCHEEIGSGPYTQEQCNQCHIL